MLNDSFVPQKPLSISQIKRNPFKTTPGGGKKLVCNPLKHLTDSAVGFDSQETDSQATVNGSSDSVTSATNGKENSSPSIAVSTLSLFSEFVSSVT